MIDCSHWKACGVSGGGCCQAGAYERPSFGVCRHCGRRDPGKRDLPAADLTGYDPETDARSPKAGGCCDPPKAE